MRALSWWITWEDLELGNLGLKDKIQRKADEIFKANADTAVVFGAHFRWDYLPYWNILHTFMRWVSDALKERGIGFFDHHSCTLTHRYDKLEELPRLMYNYLHHLPYAPSREAAADWRFNGDFLNSWRMHDAFTGQPARVSSYSAEQFCFNNPGFREGYRLYVKKLLEDTGITGLMCDDVIFFGGYYQCSCPFCQARLGFDLPPASDKSFWGNWDNPQWHQYLAMRRASIGDFLEFVKKFLPDGFPLMSCCSSCAYGGVNYSAHRAQELLRGDNILNLEVVGDVPGNVRNNLAANSFHAGVAKEYHVPVLSEGYGFYPDTAGHLWALNNLSGFSTWFSTLKGHLGLPGEEIRQLPNDAEPAATAFDFEKKHPELFKDAPEYACAVFFSENTQFHSYFGACEKGYTGDYRKLLGLLYSSGITVETIFHFPSDASEIKCVILSSVVIMSPEERTAMENYLKAGGVVLSYGPDNICGLPQRCAGDFRDISWIQGQDFEDSYQGKDAWEEGRPGLFRNASRNPSGLLELVARYGKKTMLVQAPGFAVSIRGRTVHLLAVDYDLVKHPFDGHRRCASAVSLIKNIIPIKCTECIKMSMPVKKVHCPLGGSATLQGNAVRLAGNPMYVILEIQ